jgi:malonyl-CoA O-methyltransferase
MTDSHNIFSNLSAAEYIESSALASLVNENMVSRLELVTLQPKVILDAGSGPGQGSALLKQCYPDAQIIAVDSANGMLQSLRQTQSSDVFAVQADALRLPLRNHSVDLIYANLLLPWCHDWDALFKEWRRVLSVEGLLIFTCFGLDTLPELQDNNWIRKDMHEIGDTLVQAKFSDPVMDVEYLTVTYREREKMLKELYGSGMISSVQQDVSIEKNVNHVFPLTYEIVYGHTWRPDVMADHVADEDGVVRIPLSHLRRLRGR